MQDEPRKQDEDVEAHIRRHGLTDDIEPTDEQGKRSLSEDDDVEAHMFRVHHDPEKRYGPEKRY